MKREQSALKWNPEWGILSHSNGGPMGIYTSSLDRECVLDRMTRQDKLKRRWVTDRVFAVPPTAPDVAKYYNYIPSGSPIADSGYAVEWCTAFGSLDGTTFKIDGITIYGQGDEGERLARDAVTRRDAVMWRYVTDWEDAVAA